MEFTIIEKDFLTFLKNFSFGYSVETQPTVFTNIKRTMVKAYKDNPDYCEEDLESDEPSSLEYHFEFMYDTSINTLHFDYINPRDDKDYTRIFNEYLVKFYDKLKKASND